MIPSTISDGPTLNIVKRAPMGFQGMRGKKDHHTDEQTSIDNSYLLPSEVSRGLLVQKQKTHKNFSTLNKYYY